MLYGGSGALPAIILSPAKITAQSQSAVSWQASSLVLAPTGNITVVVTGSFDFTSFMNFAVSLENKAGVDIELDEAKLVYTMNSTNAPYIVGMGADGDVYHDLSWTWSNSTMTNRLWLGRPEAGLVLILRGNGTEWESPMFGKDYPVVPFVPTTWGGADALPVGNQNGCFVKGSHGDGLIRLTETWCGEFPNFPFRPGPYSFQACKLV